MLHLSDDRQYRQLATNSLDTNTSHHKIRTESHQQVHCLQHQNGTAVRLHLLGEQSDSLHLLCQSNVRWYQMLSGKCPGFRGFEEIRSCPVLQNKNNGTNVIVNKKMWTGNERFCCLGWITLPIGWHISVWCSSAIGKRNVKRQHKNYISQNVDCLFSLEVINDHHGSL